MILGYEHIVSISVFLKSVGTGYALGLLYVLFMLLNSFFKGHTVSVFFRDILYFSLAAVVTFLFSLKYNAGIVRFYILAGELMGFCIFYIFPGLYAGKLFRKIITPLKKKKDTFLRGITDRINAQIKNGRISQKILCFKQKFQKKFVKSLD